jgi:hypothetical protein
MNRAFPPETIRSCEHCGRDLVCLIDQFGGLEANDVRDYVYAPANGDPNDEVFVCAGCQTAVNGFEDA